MNYSLINLLVKKADGSVRGPMSPVLAAQNFAQQMGMTMDRLVRVKFADSNTLQMDDDGGPTGYDILVIGSDVQAGGSVAGMFLDMGSTAMPVAYYDDGLVVPPVYRKRAHRFLSNPSDETLEKVLTAVIKNADRLNPGDTLCEVVQEL